MTEKVYKVLVTGFGPFREYSLSSSWETIKDLWSLEWPNVELIIAELPVIYKAIDEEMPKLISQNNPDLVIHLGLHDTADSILIEMQSFNQGYVIDDKFNQFPISCRPNGKERLQTNLNVSEICENVNASCENQSLKSRCYKSENPGNFVSGYLYYQSLFADSTKSLFVHVPNGIYEMYDLSQAIQYIIFSSLKQLYNYSSL